VKATQTQSDNSVQHCDVKARCQVRFVLWPFYPKVSMFAWIPMYFVVLFSTRHAKNTQDLLVRQREVIRCRLKKLNGKQNEIKVSKKTLIRDSRKQFVKDVWGVVWIALENLQYLKVGKLNMLYFLWITQFLLSNEHLKHLFIFLSPSPLQWERILWRSMKRCGEFWKRTVESLYPCWRWRRQLRFKH